MAKKERPTHFYFVGPGAIAGVPAQDLTYDEETGRYRTAAGHLYRVSDEQIAAMTETKAYRLSAPKGDGPPAKTDGDTPPAKE